MPRDVHKSLELLEEYHAELFRSSDVELKYSIEKVIGIFKTNLFNALCDIQEFYDNVLLNKSLPVSEKIYETRRFADRWESERPSIGFLTKTPVSSHNYLVSSDKATLTKNRQLLYPTTTSSTGNLAIGNSGGTLGRKTPAQQLSNTFLQTSTTNWIVDEFGKEWEVEEILLDASQIGLGFSISGGRDRDPEPDFYIRVTDISTGGAVARDGRVRVGDVVLRVNNVDCVDVNHQVAVDALQKAGPFVRLLIKRLIPQKSLSQSQLNENYLQQQRLLAQEKQRAYSTTGRSVSLHQIPQNPVQHYLPQQNAGTVSRLSNYSSGIAQYRQPNATDLTKSPRIVSLLKGEGGLGFNIVGGEDHEPIYISHVLPGGAADLSGNVQKGDVLMRVNETDLTSATHSQAAFTLKSIVPNTYVQLLLHYRPRDYQLFEDKVVQLRNDLIQKQRVQPNYPYQ